MKKKVFGITSLGIGGAERVLVDLANRLKNTYDITIFTLYGKGAFENQLDKKIKVIRLFSNSYEEMNGFQKKIIPIYVLKCGKSIYKKYLKGKFDIEIAFLEGPIKRIFQFGEANKKPIFVFKNLRIDSIRALSEGKHLKLTLKDENTIINAIGFNLGNYSREYTIGDKVDIAGMLEINSFNGVDSVQINIKDIMRSY